MISLPNTPQAIAKQLHTVKQAHTQLCQDSRQLKSGDIFVAFSGDVQDGRQYIDAAFKLGVCAVLAEANGLENFLIPNATYHHKIIAVNNLKHVLGDIASEFYNKPSDYLDVIAVTGTNGKTTVVNCLAQLLEHLQHQPCAILGTLGAGLYGQALHTGLTTPHASQVHTVLSQAVSHYAGSAVIEATSIGLKEGRLNGVAIDIAAFTNFTQDHLDYHHTMSEYAASKRLLFDWGSLHTAVINIDDSFGSELFINLQKKRPLLNIITTGIHTRSADIYATDIQMLNEGMQSFTVHYQSHCYPMTTAMLGDFNISNLLTVIGCVLALKINISTIVAVLTQLNTITGRMQMINTDCKHLNAPLVYVDYAHTPDGLLKALQALTPLAHRRGGKLHIIFGCGGNRDTSKRSLMGKIAHQYADYICITNDNPRNEDPNTIAQQVALHAPNAHIELDREKAIQQTITHAQHQDVILIAGKGHETNQIIQGQVHIFSDIVCAKTVLNRLY